MKTYDISIPLSNNTPKYPKDCDFKKDEFYSYKNGDSFIASKLTLGAHTGTHIDAPLHAIESGKSISEIPIERFIIEAKVEVIYDKKVIDVCDLRTLEIKNNTALLLKTDNTARKILSEKKFFDDYTYLTKAAAEYLVTKRIELIGIDYMSIEGLDDPSFTTHKVLLENNILILENINLTGVNSGTYQLICLPLKIESGEASPVRAVLIEK